MGPDFWKELVRRVKYEGATREDVEIEFNAVLSEEVDDSVTESLVNAVFAAASGEVD